jgi:protoporphyrinogen oxidase
MNLIKDIKISKEIQNTKRNNKRKYVLKQDNILKINKKFESFKI